MKIDYRQFSREKTKVLIVNDQYSAGLLIKKIIDHSSKLECIGLVNNSKRVLFEIAAYQPDVVILDLEMPDMNAIELIASINSNFSEIDTLILSCRQEEELIHLATNSGAKGYLNKNCHAQKIIDTITSISQGYTQLSQKNLTSNLTNSTEKISTDDQLWSFTTRQNIEALPKISLRILLYFLIGSVVVSIPWLVFSKFEEISQSTGKLEPLSKVVTLDSPVSGKIQSVQVSSGEKVKVGQPLLKLDSQLSLYELNLQKHRLKNQQQKLNNLKIRSNQFQQSILYLSSQSQADQAQIEAKITQSETLVDIKTSQLNQAQINLQSAKEKLQRYQKAPEAFSQELLANTEQAVNQENQNIIQAKAEISGSRFAYTENVEAKKSLFAANNLKVNQARKELNINKIDILSIEGDIKQTQDLINSLNHQIKSQTLTAPIDGIVFDLTVNKPGSVVDRGESLIAIAPEHTPTVFRGSIKSTNVKGLIKVGMPVKIKLDSFPWRQFGLLSGKVSWISPNSQPSKNNLEGEFYQLEIQLDASNKLIRQNYLTYGQTGTFQIVTKKSSFIDILLNNSLPH